MQLTTWRPFQEMDDFFGRNSRFFNTGLPSLFDKEGNGGFAEWSWKSSNRYANLPNP